MKDLLLRSDLWIITLYMVGMLVVAWRVSKTSRDVEGYTVGNRSIPGWAIGLSVLGTFTSSISFLGIPSKAYAGDWNVFVFSLALPIAALVAVRFFVRLYRHGVQLSAYELLEQRFGYWARVYANVSYIVLQLIRVATVLLLVAMAVRPMLGVEIVPTLIALGILVIIYDTLGGIQAVIWTDVVQVFVLLGGAAWCLGQLLIDWPGGPTELLAAMPADKISLGSWDLMDVAQPTVWVVFIYGISENLRNYGTDQNYVQRFLAAESDREAGKAIWIGAIAYLPISIMFCLIGTALFMHQSAAGFPEGMRADEVFPHFIQTELPRPVAGLVIAAILAAAMSTVDSSLNSMSTVLLSDVIRPLRRQSAPLWPEIITLRLSTVTFGILGTLTAVAIYQIFREESRTIMDMWWQYAGTAGGGMFGLFILAWLLPRVPSWGAALGVVASIPVLAWGTFLREIEDPAWQWLSCPLHGNLVGIAGTLVLVLVAAGTWLLAYLGLVQPNPRANSGKD